jgi:hypothetical protein
MCMVSPTSDRMVMVLVAHPPRHTVCLFDQRLPNYLKFCQNWIMIHLRAASYKYSFINTVYALVHLRFKHISVRILCINVVEAE